MIDYIKKCLKSRTMLFALLLAVFGVLEQSLQLFSSIIPPHLYGATVTIVGIIVAVLRVLTTSPLGGEK